MSTQFDESKVRRERGKFATKGYSDAGQLDLDIPVDDTDWGEVNLTENSRTPWGKPNEVYPIAPGIVSVSCPGHGGIKLSPQRNKAVHPALRRSSGWYEEDCEARIVEMTFPQEMTRPGQDPDETLSDAKESVAYWLTDEYEQATGETVPDEKSSARKEAAKQRSHEEFRAEHAHEFVSVGQDSSSYGVIPNTHSAVVAEKRSTGEKRTYLVPRGWWKEKMTNVPQVVAEGRYPDITDALDDSDLDKPNSRPFADAPVERDFSLNFSHLAPAARVRAEGELTAPVYRAPDGGRESLTDFLRREGVKGKSRSFVGRGPVYSVQLESGSISLKSKAAYDALVVPENMTDLDVARFEFGRAHTAFERARNAYYNDYSDKSSARMDAAQKALDEVRKPYDELVQDDRQRWDEYHARRKAKMDAFLSENGFEV